MTTARPGRPFDPAVGEAALRATLELLEEKGYTGLRVADVAREAGVGLGALYRRWPDKRSLVLAALRGAARDRDIPVTDDPMADLVTGLKTLASRLGERATPLLSIILTGTDPQLADAVREAKFAPLRDSHYERLRRVVGDVPDLEVRADIGPALIFLHVMMRGSAPSDEYIRTAILPAMLRGTDGAP
ncbi:TetR/AcrR family transcriptional regulator [Streptomyces sp. RFCAC02]|uniref:TetR/AcrR family transcriptional regulator n=1 Tax=Streptomyces sp. RFCAC02 TaxID=2499143 RepID=UPI001F107FC5|nr:TetR/AcrR family transcriptional regulator [Streptomyces sp. RFCAC02]